MTYHDETDDISRILDTAPIGCRVIVTAGAASDIGREVNLTKGTLFIGRSSDCELVLEDARVSRCHASLALDQEGIALQDLKSRNGTFYLGSRIERARVPHGATITIGDTTIALMPLTANDPIVPSVSSTYAELIGESLVMRRLFTTLTRLEPSDVNVHIIGETGTGKERIARTIHKKSRRAEGPFIAVLCSERNAEELAVELFGRPGRAGSLEQADGGTIYLEDVEAMPATIQGALLRVLEHNESRRVSETVRRRVNVRVIASSQKATDALREDLAQRLAVVTIVVPPLRERPEDIPLIANAIATAQSRGRELDSTEIAHLVSQPWPGNVRELRTVVLRTLAVGLESGARPSLIGDTTAATADGSYKEARERIVTSFEAQYVAELLQRHNGNVSAAAREAKISRKHLHELLRRHRITT